MQKTHYFQSDLLGRRARFADGSGPIGQIVLVTLDPQLLLEDIVEPIVFLLRPDGKIQGSPLSKLELETHLLRFSEKDQED